jgi:hypothetical protein
MKNLPTKITAAMMALVLSVLMLVCSPNKFVMTLSIIFILIQMFVWGRLMKEINK